MAFLPIISRFKVAGLGEKSGAVVNANQGEYWLAVDGQYLSNTTWSWKPAWIQSP